MKEIVKVRLRGTSSSQLNTKRPQVLNTLCFALPGLFSLMSVMTLKSDDSCVLAVFCDRKQDGDTVTTLFRGRGRQELIDG